MRSALCAFVVFLTFVSVPRLSAGPTNELIAEIQKKYTDQQKDIIKKLEASASQHNIQINRTKAGYQTIPIVKEKAISPEEFLALPKDKQTEIEEKISLVQSEIDTTIRKINKINNYYSANIA